MPATKHLEKTVSAKHKATINLPIFLEQLPGLKRGNQMPVFIGWLCSVYSNLAHKNQFCFIGGRKTCLAKSHNWDKIFPNCKYDKELVSKVYKELLQFNSKRTNKPNTCMAK